MGFVLMTLPVFLCFGRFGIIRAEGDTRQESFWPKGY